MSSRYWVEEDACELCGGPVAVYMKQDFAHGGIPLRAIVQWVRCLKGCVGEVMSSERAMSRGA
jgi:hypothetical protein